MIEKIIFIYGEHNPLGEWVERYDNVYLHYNDPKAKVRKALAYLAKEGGRIDCTFAHFCFDDGTSICCEAKRENVEHENEYGVYTTYEKNGLIEVTKSDGMGNRDVPYLIDVATLRRQMLRECDERKEVAA